LKRVWSRAMNQNASTDSSLSMSFGAPAEEISRRAYELWENEGRPEGCDLRHWLQAEQELSARYANRSEQSQDSPDSRANELGSPRNTGTDTRPLQGTRAGAAAQRDSNRDTKRSTNVPFGTEKSSSGNSQNAAKRKPSNAPVM
jgi:hypothetical protein